MVVLGGSRCCPNPLLPQAANEGVAARGKSTFHGTIVLWQWGRENVLKRLLIQVGGFNLSLVLRQKLGAGTPRGLRAAKKAFPRLEKHLWQRPQPARRTWQRCRHALGSIFFEAKPKPFCSSIGYAT